MTSIALKMLTGDRSKYLGLIFGVIQLRKAVGDLAPGDEQLEALGHRRIGVGGARQRADLDPTRRRAGRADLLDQLCGGGGKVTLRVAAQHADGWNLPFISPQRQDGA